MAFVPYATCIVFGCRQRATFPRYCADHERQRLFDDLRLSGLRTARAWEQAAAIVRKKRSRRRQRRRKPTSPRVPGRVRRDLAAERRLHGICPCGRRPRPRLRNCDRCIRWKNPPGKPKSESLSQRARRQKRYREKKRRLGICTACTNQAYVNDEGRQFSLCLPHHEGKFVSLRKSRKDLFVEKLARGKVSRKALDDVEGTGDFELGDLIEAPTL